MFPPSILLFFVLFWVSHFSSFSLQDPLLVSKCSQQCGRLRIPYPFHLASNGSSSSSCALHFSAFLLSCSLSNSTSLSVSPHAAFPVLDISSSSLTLDLPGASSCRRYVDLSSFPFAHSPFFGASAYNLIRLYGCDGSFACKVGCDHYDFEGCDAIDDSGYGSGGSSCCYPLSDRSLWKFGDGFSVFAKFGCRGFSSWVVTPGTSSARRGINLEWAVPSNFSGVAICADDAVFVNATAVRDGGRCVCMSGFAGDGFTEGVGCIKSCMKNGDIAYGRDCYSERHSKNKRKVIVLAGILVSALVLAFLCCALLKHLLKCSRQDSVHGVAAFRKACKMRIFTYRDLEEATKGFHDSQKIADDTDVTVHAGVLRDSSLVAVQKIHCESDQELMSILRRAENLHSFTHKNVARLLGCCIDAGAMLFVVSELFANGLDGYLRREKGNRLEWYQRINIAIETANALAFLQFGISPLVSFQDLKSSHILLDRDYSVKVACFWQFEPKMHHGFSAKSDIYSFGVILMELISGLKHSELEPSTLTKIRDGKLDEIVDPVLCYHDQMFRQAQIKGVACLAVRCLSVGRDGRLTMMEVAMELEQIRKAGLDCMKYGAASE